MYGFVILCEISKCTFEIPHEISGPYIERCNFIQCWKFKISQIHDPFQDNGANPMKHHERYV